MSLGCLIGFHYFIGADWGGKFVGISKKSWITPNEDCHRLCLPTPWRRGAHKPRGGGAARRSAVHRDVCLISIQLRGVQLPHQLCVGNCSGQESGGREASSTRATLIYDTPYLTHQHCGYEGHNLYNPSLMSTAPRANGWMLAGEYVTVSLQTSTSCCLGTYQV